MMKEWSEGKKYIQIKIKAKKIYFVFTCPWLLTTAVLQYQGTNRAASKMWTFSH